ncbi:MAG: DUF2752 domain-containing protein [Mycobacterium sp.]|nr:DUF2752 domain-containing protein [Mycobacterium sp.]
MLRYVANRRRLPVALGFGALMAAALGYVAIVDPHRPGAVFPMCPFRLLTGWNCPACGGLRMAHDLLHGDVAAAVTDNVFLLVGIPVLAGWLLLRRRRGGKTLLSVSAAATIVIAVLAWTVVRNLSGFPLVPMLLTS